MTLYVDFEEYLLGCLRENEEPTSFLLDFWKSRAEDICSGPFRSLTIHILDHKGGATYRSDFVELSIRELVETCKELGVTLNVERSRELPFF